MYGFGVVGLSLTSPTQHPTNPTTKLIHRNTPELTMTGRSLIYHSPISKLRITTVGEKEYMYIYSSDLASQLSRGILRSHVLVSQYSCKSVLQSHIEYFVRLGAPTVFMRIYLILLLRLVFTFNCFSIRLKE